MHHVVQQIADQRVVVAADEPAVPVGDAAAQLTRVRAFKVHVHELQSVLGVVVVRLDAVEQQHVTGFGDMEFTAVLHAEASLADVGDEQRRITVALHKIVGGAVVVTAPCRVKQQLSRGLRRRKRKTNRLTLDAGINTLHILFSFLVWPS